MDATFLCPFEEGFGEKRGKKKKKLRKKCEKRYKNGLQIFHFLI